jgi:DNA-binding NarL/FixJ family response regulator
VGPATYVEVMHTGATTNGLAEAIQTVETTARILRSLSELSLRVGGQRAELLCAVAIREAERRLARLRDLSARAEERATQSLQPEPARAKARTVLSPREWDVAELIAQGYTNQQIATKLVLTPGTVANHVAHILTKLDLQSRTQIAVWVIQREIGGRTWSDT